MFSRKVTKARKRGRGREVRGGGGGGESVGFGFVLHTGLEDPTTAVSERSLQKRTRDRKKPSDIGITLCDTLQEQALNYSYVYGDL